MRTKTNRDILNTMRNPDAETNNNNTTTNRKHNGRTYHIEKSPGNVYDPTTAYSGYLEVGRRQEDIKMDRLSPKASWSKLIQNIGTLIIVLIKLGWTYIRYGPHHKNISTKTFKPIEDPIDETCK